MSPPLAFAIYTGTSCLLVLDYFLFSTGNPSATYSALGGWFEVVLAGAIAVTALYGFAALRNQRTRKLFLSHIGVVLLFCIVLFIISDVARNFAERQIQHQAAAFISNPRSTNVEASDEVRRVLAQIDEGKFTVQFDGFIPTFRRVDFGVLTAVGKEYKLVGIIDWKGTLRVSLLQMSGT